jgi:hypothetical protein
MRSSTAIVGMALLTAVVAGCAGGLEGFASSLDGGGAGTGAAAGTGGRGGTGGTAAGGGGAGTGGAAAPGSGGRPGTGGAGSGGAGSGGAGSGGATIAGSGGGPGTGGRASTGGAIGSGGAAGAGGRAGTGGTAAGTGGTAAGSGGAGPAGNPVFGQCRFHFGAIDSVVRNNSALLQQLDMFTSGWIGSSENFNLSGICRDIGAGGVLAGKVPALVSYIIAFTARRDESLQDCNVANQNTLCNHGATYIRQHLEDRIIPQYRKYAQGFASACGTTRPMIWMMEPDYYQYNSGGDPNSLSPAEAGQIMARLVATVRETLPNVVFSLDISPWIPNNGASWYSNFNLADFTFIHTSGGGTDSNNTRIRAANTMTWAGVRQATGKPILADTGYGAAGQSAGHDAQWDVVTNINARIADGVISITQYNPSSSWGSTISGIRSQLAEVPCH